MGAEPLKSETAPDSGVLTYCFEQLVVVVPGSNEGWPETRRVVAQRAEAVGRPVGVLALVRPGIQGDPLRTRAETQRMLAEGAQTLAAVAFAIDGRGFFASAFMSIATGIFLHVRRAGVPMQAFSDPQPALDWVAGHIETPRDELVDFVASVRALLGAQS